MIYQQHVKIPSRGYLRVNSSDRIRNILTPYFFLSPYYLLSFPQNTIIPSKIPPTPTFVLSKAVCYKYTEEGSSDSKSEELPSNKDALKKSFSVITILIKARI